ncbi:MAG: hypothetical protein AB1721_00905 [Patescibacteria group bacterium]
MSFKGFSAISLILGISLIVVVLSLGMGLLSYFENAASFSRLKGQEAFWVAESGVYDALYRLSINKDFTSAGYQLAVGNGQATVVVEKDNPRAGFNLITSTGIVGNARKKVQAQVVRDDITGKITLFSWQEIAL